MCILFYLASYVLRRLCYPCVPCPSHQGYVTPPRRLSVPCASHSPPSPRVFPVSRIASEALLAFLRCVKLEPLVTVMTSRTEPLEDLARYSDFVIAMAT